MEKSKEDTPDWTTLPGYRSPAEKDAMRASVKEYIKKVGRQQWFHTQRGGTGLMMPNGEILEPVQMKAPRDETRVPPVEPEELDTYIWWPPPPPEFEGKKRPVLLLLHAANIPKDMQGIGFFGGQYWFIDRLPKEVVVLMPISPSRASRPWVHAAMKATLLHIVDQAIENGGDPERVYITGMSMGGIGTWELAIDAAEGRAPFAAALPLCGMILNMQRVPAMVDYPVWTVHAGNDKVNAIDTDDEAVTTLLAAGVNRGAEPTLYYTRYEDLDGLEDLVSGMVMPAEYAEGHNVWEVAYADEEIWSWLFRQRRDPRRFHRRDLKLKSGAIVPGGRHQGEVDERRVPQDYIVSLMESQKQHLLSGGKELVVPGHEPIPPIQLQGERDDTRKPPLEPDALDFFFVWPPRPETSTEEKRPALLFLHGAYACQEEGGLVGLANDVFWLSRVPEDMVVIIPQTKSRKQHWLLRSVKATLLFAIEKAIKLGVDPDRVYVSGLSMGGTAAFEFALSSVEGSMPFAASIPVTPYVMSVRRARLLADFPIWIFYGNNEWESLVARVDDAVETAVEAGANQAEKPNLLCTKYAWSPDTLDPGMFVLRNAGHGTYVQAYVEPDLWGWLLSQRRNSSLTDRAALAD